MFKSMGAQGLWFEGRPDRTLSPTFGTEKCKMGALGPSGRVAVS